MRFILAGLLFLFIPSLAFAQASGQVLSLGFGQGFYRPNCWTPMVVELSPDQSSTTAGQYSIEVWQHDLDGDRPIYCRQIPLNGYDGTPATARQRFWMYFLPQPTDGGLPDGTGGVSSLPELQKDLQVFLCQTDHKQIAKLQLTSTLSNVDPRREGTRRSQKLVLAVSSNGTKQPTLSAYNSAFSSPNENIPLPCGAKEDVEVVNIRAAELPDNPLGYEAVDAIIWLEGNPTGLSSGNSDTFNALKDYIKFGGHLVVCQSTDNWQDDLGFGDLLPVDVQKPEARKNFEPLKSMAEPRDDDPFGPVSNLWTRDAGPFLMARSTARSGAVVEQWINWQKDDGTYIDSTPYLARKAYGLGTVTWVAQPLTTESAPLNATGWPYVWDKVMGWRSDGYVLPPGRKPDDRPSVRDRLDMYKASSNATDLGFSLVHGLDLTSKANWLIVLAIFFFIGYWIIAGPGSYLFLLSRKRQGWSWFAFGLSAMLAILITFLVVRLVLRGPPEIRHLSFVRIAPNQPAIVQSRFGLYIPRDGDQKITLDDTSLDNNLSYLSPFAEHPQQLGDASEFDSPTEYDVQVRDLKPLTPPQLNVAYRSSLKKFQARWVGSLETRITGSVKLDTDELKLPPGQIKLPLTGTLSNVTGQDLTDVYLAFSISNESDWLIYIPTWAKGVTYDIKHDLSNAMYVGRKEGESTPGHDKILSDELASRFSKQLPDRHGWTNYWFSQYHHGGEDLDVQMDDMNLVYPVLSLFDRIPAMPNTFNENVAPAMSNGDRRELYNRGAAMLNASGSVASGQLVVLATAKGALPIPVQVDDEKMTGDGTTFYQFILPLDRGNLDAAPTTMPVK